MCRPRSAPTRPRVRHDAGSSVGASSAGCWAGWCADAAGTCARASGGSSGEAAGHPLPYLRHVRRVAGAAHDVAQPLSDRSIRKSPSFLQTLFAAQSHGVLSVASASVRDCGRACVSRRCAFARGASRGSSPQVRASTRIIHRRGAPALSQALSRRRRRDGQPERASFDRDR